MLLLTNNKYNAIILHNFDFLDREWIVQNLQEML